MALGAGLDAAPGPLAARDALGGIRFGTCGDRHPGNGHPGAARLSLRPDCENRLGGRPGGQRH